MEFSKEKKRKLNEYPNHYRLSFGEQLRNLTERGKLGIRNEIAKFAADAFIKINKQINENDQIIYDRGIKVYWNDIFDQEIVELYDDILINAVVPRILRMLEEKEIETIKINDKNGKGILICKTEKLQDEIDEITCQGLLNIFKHLETNAHICCKSKKKIYWNDIFYDSEDQIDFCDSLLKRQHLELSYEKEKRNIIVGVSIKNIIKNLRYENMTVIEIKNIYRGKGIHISWGE